MSTTTGLHHLDTTIAAGGPHYCPATLDVTGAAPPILQRLTRTAARRDGAPATPGGSLRVELEALPAERHHAHVLDLVVTTTADILGLADRSGIRPTTPFKSLGFDSLMAIDLHNSLGQVTGLALPATLVFDHPTPQALTTHLLDQLVPRAEAGAVVPDEEPENLLEIDSMDVESLVAKALSNDQR